MRNGGDIDKLCPLSLNFGELKMSGSPFSVVGGWVLAVR